MISDKQKSTSFLFHAFLLVLFCSSANATNARLSFVADDPATPLRLSLVIDRAEKIAGIKVVIAFDKDSLVLKQAYKSKETSSFLHVVNEKIPGQIIFVMASARGISGDNVSLCHFEFQNLENTEHHNNQISVTQIQIMTEDLTEIKGNFPVYTFN